MLEWLLMVAASRAGRWREGRADAGMLGAKASAEDIWSKAGAGVLARSKKCGCRCELRKES